MGIVVYLYTPFAQARAVVEAQPELSTAIEGVPAAQHPPPAPLPEEEQPTADPAAPQARHDQPAAQPLPNPAAFCSYLSSLADLGVHDILVLLVLQNSSSLSQAQPADIASLLRVLQVSQYL